MSAPGAGRPSGQPRVVHVIAALHEGGAERQLEILAPRQDADVSVITLYGGGVVADSLRAQGIRVDEFPLAEGPRPLAWGRLAAALRRERPDVVHVHLLASQLWGIPAARMARVPVVVSSEHSLNHGMIEGRPLSAWLKALYAGLARMATLTLAVSTETAQLVRGLGVPAKQVAVLENGIDFTGMAYSAAGRGRVRAELGLTDDVLLVGAVGRLQPYKRFDLALRALAPDLGPSRRFLLVGDGPERDSLRRLADDLGVAEYVVFAGARSDMRDLYSAMDVFVSAGVPETFGLAILEALACGLPTVYAVCPALADVPPIDIAHDMGTAGGAAGEEALRNALAQATSQVGEGRGAPAEIVARYGIDATAAQLDQTYRRLLHDRGRALPAAPPAAA